MRHKRTNNEQKIYVYTPGTYLLHRHGNQVKLVIIQAHWFGPGGDVFYTVSNIKCKYPEASQYYIINSVIIKEIPADMIDRDLGTIVALYS